MAVLRSAVPVATLLLLCAPACRRARGGDDSAPAGSSSPQASSAAVAAAAAPGSGAPSAAASGQRPEAPAGYVAMTVLEVASTERGDAVLLVDGDQSVVVPIFVGGTEALSIRLRLEKQRYQRPLTHDLLDSLLVRLGGELSKVHVDDLKGNTFVGTVFVRQRADGRMVEVDARPSDAIALALGNAAPIFVSRRVLDATGVRKEDIGKGEGLRIQGKPPEPMAL